MVILRSRLHILILKEASSNMESTHDFVKKVNENAEKARHNKNNGKGTPTDKLPAKQHSTNK
jgi:hypothetical protein